MKVLSVSLILIFNSWSSVKSPKNMNVSSIGHILETLEALK